jgi:CheY-like chemotaxis protein
MVRNQEKPLLDANVMVAFQSRFIRELLTPVLNQSGAERLLTGGPIEMLKEAPKFHPDIVFGEYAMDKIDGIAFIRQLRTDVGLMTPAVLVVPEQPDPAILERAREGGAIEIVTLPFSTTDIRNSCWLVQRP